MAVKKWRGKWVVDFVRGDQRIRRVSPVQTKRGAQAYEVELRQEHAPPPAPGAEPVAATPTLAEFADEWMTTAVDVQNKPSERVRKRCMLRNHLAPFFGKRRLDQIGQRDIEAFAAQQLRKGLAASTVNRQLAMLVRLLRCAQEWGLLDKVPRVRRLSAPRGAFDWLRPEEARRLVEAAKSLKPRWFAFIFVALRTGMRQGEIFALEWSAVDFEQRRITVRRSAWRGLVGSTKSGRPRVVPMSRDLVDVLRRWRVQSPGELVFPNRQGGVVTGPAIANTALGKALARAGLRHIRFHDLRHTFASHLVLRGTSLKVVQLLLGHSSVTMTERYAHVGDEQLEAAVEGLGDEEE